jgi:anti-sigma-K factor RskA
MTCEELNEMFELYTLGVLEPEERAEIEAHLARGCEACRSSFNAALGTNATVLSLAPDVAPPSRLKKRVMATVGARQGGWGWVGALAAACMLVLALWMSGQERQRSSELADVRKTLMQMKADRDHVMAALSFLNEPETQEVGFGKGKPARGNIFMNPQRGVLLIGSNLPRLAPGRMFEMWLIPKGGAAPQPAGMFGANESGTAMNMLSGPLDPSTIAAIAVTIEPEAGSNAPTTQPFIVAPVVGL